MTQYEFLSNIYTSDFIFYAGIASKSDETQIDLDNNTIMGSISYTESDIQAILTNYWTARREYESQFATTDLAMPDYIQDTISHTEQLVNLINNFLLTPGHQIYG
jgi:hypothetical protein